MRPTATNIGTNIPAFLSKLWRMVNDPDTDHLICWGPDGHSFVIQNQAQFWYNLLPTYYKHNNMSSFIRQLNMYGFHKISAENGGLDCDKDEIKFFHPFFQQDQPNLMKHIKRKITSSKTATATEDNKVNSMDQITKVLVDVKHLRGRQESVDNQLAAMKQENAALWRELALLRQKHMKQQQIVNKLIHFLVTIVQPSRSGLGGLGVKRRYPLMINDSRYGKTSKTDTSSDGPTIHELDQESALTDSLLLNEGPATAEIDEPAALNSVKVDSPPSSADPLIDSSNVLLDIPIIEDTDNSQDDNLNSEMLLIPDQELEAGELAAAAAAVETNEDSEVLGLLSDSQLNNDTNSTDFSIKDDDLQEYIDLDTLKCDDNLGIDGKSDNKLDEKDSVDIITNNIKLGTNLDIPDEDKDENLPTTDEQDMTIATRNSDLNQLNSIKFNSPDDFDSHLETTQGELDTIKEMLFDGYQLDANALLGLFNPDEDFPLDVPPITTSDTNEESTENADSSYDPMMSGSKIMTYNNQPFALDFDNLFEDTSDTVIDENNDTETLNLTQVDGDQINTPIVVKKEPLFPVPATTTSLTKRTNSK